MDSKEAALLFPFLKSSWNAKTLALAHFPENPRSPVEYKIDDILGYGGYGVVFEVPQGALKTVRKKFSSSLSLLSKSTENEFEKELKSRREEFLNWLESEEGKRLIERHVREASMLLTINHPHIVKIQHAISKITVSEKYGKKLQIPCFIMKRLQGKTLEEHISSIHSRGVPKSADIQRFIRTTYRIAWGLAAMHDMSIAHRDIKPNNIFLEKSNTNPIIVDLGISKRPGESSLSIVKDSKGNVEMKEDGTPRRRIPHTKRYAPWERFYPLPGDSNTTTIDQFALGVILYRFCSLKFPYPTEFDSAPSSGYSPAAPHKLNPATSRLLSQVISRLIQKSPGDRHFNLRDVMANLEWELDDKYHIKVSKQATNLSKSIESLNKKSLKSARVHITNVIATCATLRQELILSDDLYRTDVESEVIQELTKNAIQLIDIQIKPLLKPLKPVKRYWDIQKKVLRTIIKKLTNNNDYEACSDALAGLKESVKTTMESLSEFDLLIARLLTSR